MIRKINTNKKGVSEMLSYVILIAIAIGISIGVFIWLKDYATFTPKIDCKEGTSLVLEKYKNISDINVELTVRNNGNFNITGFVLTVGNNTQQMPIKMLISLYDSEKKQGYHGFQSPLKPGATEVVTFAKDADYEIKVIQIQPYIKDEKDIIVVCESSLIKQNV